MYFWFQLADYQNPWVFHRHLSSNRLDTLRLHPLYSTKGGFFRFRIAAVNSPVESNCLHYLALTMQLRECPVCPLVWEPKRNSRWCRFVDYCVSKSGLYFKSKLYLRLNCALRANCALRENCALRPNYALIAIL